jgi:hypothetical protein
MVSLPACGTSVPSPVTPDASTGLTELAEVYKYRAAQRLPAPARVEDLADHEDALSNAMPPIRDGRIVVIWRLGYTPGSSTVLAYEKKAPTEGGHVLLQNGSVKEMTADEFKSASKAKK